MVENDENVEIHVNDRGVGLIEEERSFYSKNLVKSKGIGKFLDVDTECSGLG